MFYQNLKERNIRSLNHEEGLMKTFFSVCYKVAKTTFLPLITVLFIPVKTFLITNFVSSGKKCFATLNASRNSNKGRNKFNRAFHKCGTYL